MPPDISLIDWIALSVWREEAAKGCAPKLEYVAMLTGACKQTESRRAVRLRNYGLIPPPEKHRKPRKAPSLKWAAAKKRRQRLARLAAEHHAV